MAVLARLRGGGSRPLPVSGTFLAGPFEVLRAPLFVFFALLMTVLARLSRGGTVDSSSNVRVSVAVRGKAYSHPDSTGAQPVFGVPPAPLNMVLLVLLVLSYQPSTQSSCTQAHMRETQGFTDDAKLGISAIRLQSRHNSCVERRYHRDSELVHAVAESHLPYMIPWEFFPPRSLRWEGIMTRKCFDCRLPCHSTSVPLRLLYIYTLQLNITSSPL